MTNPLKSFYRTPGMYIQLPSGGSYTSNDCLVLSSNNEVAILPMTARDELVLNNPDSLLNGEANIHIIESCCPNVTDAKKIAVADADIIMLANRMVSFGSNMKLLSTCSHCSKENDTTIPIADIIEKTTSIPEGYFVEDQGITIFLKPYTLELNNFINMRQFEEQSFLKNLFDETTNDDERLQKTSASLTKILDLKLTMVKDSIIEIHVNDTIVQDAAYIAEFIENAPRKIVDKIQKGIDFINSKGLPTTYDITCSHCAAVYNTDLTYDYSSFFDNNS